MHFNKALLYSIGFRTLNTGLSFIINILMVRLLGVNDSGTFFYYITLFSLATLVLSFSLEAAITYYTTRLFLSNSRVLLFVLPVILIQTILALIMVSFFNTYLALWFIIGNIGVSYFSALYTVRKWFTSLNTMLFLVNVCAVIFLLILYVQYLYKDDIVGFLSPLIYIAIPALQAVVLLMGLVLKKSDQGLDRPIAIPVKAILKYTWYAFAGSLIFFFVTRADYYFVQKYCDNDALSNYIQVSKLGQLLVLVPGIIASVVFPYSIGDADALSIKKLQSICRIICFVFILFAAGIIATGYWILPWIFGKGFGQMYVAMLFYLPGFLALSITVILSAFIAGKGMQRHNAIAAAIALIIMLSGDILLIPRFGINAAALISSIAYIICMVYALVLLYKKSNAVWLDFFKVQRSDINQLLSILTKNKN